MTSGTHSVVKKTALDVIKDAYKEGINVQISEGYRSNKRQNELYAQGRTKGGNVVTNAKAGQSWHNYGVAVDFFLTSKDGKKAIWTVNNNWRRVAEIAKAKGFEWGGDWTSFQDAPHLQMTGGLSLSDLQAGKKPKLTYKGKNKPSSGGKESASNSKKSSTKWTNKSGSWKGGTLKKGHKGQQVKELQELLVKANFYPNKSAKNNGIDSYYGDDTADAVRRFQSVNLPNEVDSIAGKNTYAKLTGGKASTSSRKKSGSWKGETLKIGDKGAKVKELQTMLANKHFYPDKGAKNNGIDSDYGTKTKDAVERFQKVHLPKEVDGIAGTNTYNKLK